MPDEHEHTAPHRRFGRLWRDAQVAGRAESASRRELVLAHPDLARRLTLAPIALSEPARWNGWIPPATSPQTTCEHCASPRWRPPCVGWPHGAPRNDSPRRRALIELVGEASRRGRQPTRNAGVG